MKANASIAQPFSTTSLLSLFSSTHSACTHVFSRAEVGGRFQLTSLLPSDLKIPHTRELQSFLPSRRWRALTSWWTLSSVLQAWRLRVTLAFPLCTLVRIHTYVNALTRITARTWRLRVTPAFPLCTLVRITRTHIHIRKCTYAYLR
jgi:hypothetical protein